MGETSFAEGRCPLSSPPEMVTNYSGSLYQRDRPNIPLPAYFYRGWSENPNPAALSLTFGRHPMRRGSTNVTRSPH